MSNEHGPTTNPTEIIEKVFTPVPLNAEWVLENGSEVISEIDGSPEREAHLNWARARIADRSVAIAFAKDPEQQVVMAEQQIEVVKEAIHLRGLEAPAVEQSEMTQVVASVIELNEELIASRANDVLRDKITAVESENAKLREELARRDTEVQTFRELVTPDEVMVNAVLHDQENEIKTLRLRLATAEQAAVEHRHENRMKRVLSEIGHRARQAAGIMLVEGEYAAQADER